jgi:hypothetical protein
MPVPGFPALGFAFFRTSGFSLRSSGYISVAFGKGFIPYYAGFFRGAFCFSGVRDMTATAVVLDPVIGLPGRPSPWFRQDRACMNNKSQKPPSVRSEDTCECDKSLV